MQRVRDIWQLVRGGNLVFIAILLWAMEKWVAVPVLWQWRFEEQLPWWLLLLLILATVLVAAGGYVVNDYFDVKIDRINRPDKLIVTQSVSKDTAMWLSTGLSAAGVLCGGMGVQELVFGYDIRAGTRVVVVLLVELQTAVSNW